MINKKKKYYFTQDTENAIIRYNISKDFDEKEILFREHILPAFDKLAEILINWKKFYYIHDSIEEIKLDVIEFLLEKLSKYDVNKGRAFSYFTIVARNYLIIQNRNSYKRILQKKELSVVDYSYDIWIDERDKKSRIQKLEFFDPFIDYLEKNLEKIFLKKNDFKIANAVIEIIRRRDSLENFNKKAIYIIIKEMTNVKPQQITKVMNVFRSIYKKVYADYIEDDYIDENKLYWGNNNGF